MEDDVIDKALEILQGFKRGDIIEKRNFSEDTWTTCDSPSWYLHFAESYEWRVKSEILRYRPYSGATEFVKASKEHGPWLLDVRYGHWSLPDTIETGSNGDIFIGGNGWSTTLKSLSKFYKWQDESPCCILEK